jgi:hypothetical protein
MAPDPNEFDTKLLCKIWQFLNKNAQYKNVNNFLSTKNSLKAYTFMFNLTNLHDENGNTNVKFMSRILEKIHVGSETGSGSWYGFEANRK